MSDPRPRSAMDRVIGAYISGAHAGNFDDVLIKDERLEVASCLGSLADGLLGWYPFQKDGSLLQLGSRFGAFTELLCARCRNVTVLEPDAYRAHMTERRLGALDNLTIIRQDLSDYARQTAARFRYVVWIVDESCDTLLDRQAYFIRLQLVRALLERDGILLFALPNRFGVKYFCGEPDPGTGVPFDGMTEDNSSLYRFGRAELLDVLSDCGFPHVKLYYPMPDHRITHIVYSDDYRPGADMEERIHTYYIDNKSKRLLNERSLMGSLTNNDVMHFFSNSFLAEAGMSSCCDVIYATISAERGKANAFVTNIHSGGTVRKTPLYPEGQAGVERLLQNTRALAAQGIPILELQRDGDGICMKRVLAPSLSDHLRNLIRTDPDAFLACVDKLWDYILNASEHVPYEESCVCGLGTAEDWGPILRAAYIEMIPVNCFFDKGEFLFYDQEYVKENCPAKYVMYRALRDIYTFLPDAEAVIPQKALQERYKMSAIWGYAAQMENEFQDELRRRHTYSGYSHWGKNLHDTMKSNRRELNMYSPRKDDGSFDAFSDLDGRRIILFGAGKFADDYLNRYEETHPPVFLIDNNEEKWGRQKRGYEIKAPVTLTRMVQGSFRIIIAVKNYAPIVEQLERMGFHSDSYRVFSTEIDDLIRHKLENTKTDGKYNIGYVTGVFDLFHIGHLNLLKNSKSRCHYLIAGVLTDELAERDKGKVPVIPFEERIEIVKQCKYVDRVIPVNFHNTNKVEAWKELRYGCLFSGNDHEGIPYWTDLQRRLRSLGSDLEFFPYTQSTNSTMLKKHIMNSLEE